MAKWLAVIVLFFAWPACAVTIETKYFSLVLPESFTNVEGNKDKQKDSAIGGVYASASKRQFLISGYINKENKELGLEVFDDRIKKANAEADEGHEDDFFNGVKLQQRECDGDCTAYYRQVVIEEKNNAPAWVYQYFFKNENTIASLTYFDGVNDGQTSHAQMENFIRQIEKNAARE